MTREFITQNKIGIFIGAVALLALILIVRQPKSNSTPVLPTTAMNEHTQQLVQFFTRTIGLQNRTRVYFPFSFKSQTFPLFIAYKLKDGSVKEYLAYHPQISLLNWPTIRENNLTLFQKTPQYQSIEEFLQKPTGKIYADQQLVQQYPNLKAQMIPFTNDESFNPNQADYILSTHAPLKQGNATYYYENIIDTTDAILDENSQITWVIRAPDADQQHVFFLGNIDVTFLQ